MNAVGETKSLLEVAQTVSLLSTINQREQDQDVVTLSTLHAAIGLEWPHVLLVGVTEGMLPFKLRDNPDAEAPGKASSAQRAQAMEAASETLTTHLQEDRRLMDVGITRARSCGRCALSLPRRCKTAPQRSSQPLENHN